MNVRTAHLLSILLLLPIAGFSGDQAYTWIDEHGTRHFSEDPPIDKTVPAEKIDLLPAPSAGNIGGDNDFYSVVNQANRMERKRLENEKLTAERLQTEIEANKATSEAQTTSQTPKQKDTQEQTRSYPGYPKQMYNEQRHAHNNKPPPEKPVEPEQLPTRNPGTAIGN